LRGKSRGSADFRTWWGGIFAGPLQDCLDGQLAKTGVVIGNRQGEVLVMVRQNFSARAEE
jgi:hypothetical protein